MELWKNDFRPKNSIFSTFHQNPSKIFQLGKKWVNKWGIMVFERNVFGILSLDLIYHLKNQFKFYSIYIEKSLNVFQKPQISVKINCKICNYTFLHFVYFVVIPSISQFSI